MGQAESSMMGRGPTTRALGAGCAWAEAAVSTRMRRYRNFTGGFFPKVGWRGQLAQVKIGQSAAGELMGGFIKMALVVIAEGFGRELLAVGEEAGEGGAGADDGEIFLGAKPDNMVKISVDGAGVNEVTAREFGGVGMHGGLFIEAYGVVDKLCVMILFGATRQAFYEKIFDERFSLAKLRGRFYLSDEPGGQSLVQADDGADEFCLRDTEDCFEAAGKEFDGEEMIGGAVVAGHGRVAQHDDVAIGRNVVGAVAGSQRVGCAEVYPKGGSPAGKHFDGEIFFCRYCRRSLARRLGEELDERLWLFEGMDEAR